jgi:exo-beta-1,3-glucanase (GH17 family)
MFGFREPKPLAHRLCWFVSLFLFMALHAYLRWPAAPDVAIPDVYGQFDSLSYSPPALSNDDIADSKSRELIDRDLSELTGLTSHIRTYSVSGSRAQIPAVAQEHGLTVSLGVWIDAKRPEATEHEIAEAIELARSAPNVADIYVGNENLVRRDAPVEQVREAMRRVRQATGKPVTTGEMWDQWLKHPELAEDADFIGAHIFPFWEGVSVEQAIDVTFRRYDMLKQAFPGKRIVIAEYGWPSGGSTRHESVPSLPNEALVMRSFVDQARKRGISYNLVEAFDQPLKVSEGPVGPYWGILGVDGQPKFAWSGPPAQPPLWSITLWLGLSLALVCSIVTLTLSRTTALLIILMNFLCQALGYALASIIMEPFHRYMSFGYCLVVLATAPMSTLLLFTAADRMRELFQRLAGPPPRRLMALSAAPPPIDHGEAAGACPFVSIHVPIRDEAMPVVEQTLLGLSRLEYPRYEILVLVNNCSSPTLAGEIARLCDTLGPRFRAFDLGTISGFKAGALNAGLRRTASEASIIAVVDADYLVRPDWLRIVTPAFATPDVALMQAPQDYRNVGGGWSRNAMNAEYGCFFDVGMIQRNEHNAIIAHGTMLLIRRIALECCGGWDERCICEDTELGLRILLAGWKASYTDMRLGAGLLPDDWRAYRMQRQRWAYGALWILRKHWRSIVSPRTRLSFGQRYHFLAGWAHWVVDGLGLMLAILNLTWFLAIKLFKYGASPPATISLCVLTVAVASLAHGVALQATRPGNSLFKALGGIAAASSLQMPVARALYAIARRCDYPFIVTRKGGRTSSARWRMLMEFWGDTMLAVALPGAALLLFRQNNFPHFADMSLFAVTMVVQSLPYLIASIMAFSTL